jgi:hypothetical protein
MSEKQKKLGDVLKQKIKEAVDEGGANVASAVNVGGTGRRTSVSSHQRIVQRDGVRTTITERREERDSDG